MQHFEALESEVEREDPEEDAICSLQCADSLAIATNHLGEDAFGIKKLLDSLRAITRS